MSIKSEFPNEIDLGKKPNETGPMVMPDKGGKNRKYYPTLYLSDIPGLEGLPEEGEAIIYFHRRGLTIRKPAADEAKKGRKTEVSVDLEIRRICLKDTEEDSNESEDKGDMIDQLAAKAGVDTGARKATPEEDDEED